MSAPTRAETWSRIVAAGIVTGEMPPHRPRVPWYVRLLQGVTGWLGALFLLAFLGKTFSFLFTDAVGAFLVGAAACVGAAIAFRRYPESDFAGQLGFAVSLAGQSLLGYGLWQLLGGHFGLLAAAMVTVEIGLFILVPNYVHRVWNAWAAAFFAWHALLQIGFGALGPGLLTAAFAWMWLEEPELAHYGERAHAAAWGLALATLQFPICGRRVCDLFVLLGWPAGDSLGVWVEWAGSMLLVAVLVAVVWRLLRREGHSLSTRPGAVALAGASILAITSLKAPGFSPAMVALLAGFSAGSRELTALAVFALVAYLTRYYYALEAPLLDKALLMMITGGALLLVALAQRELCTCGLEEDCG